MNIGGYIIKILTNAGKERFRSKQRKMFMATRRFILEHYDDVMKKAITNYDKVDKFKFLCTSSNPVTYLFM